MRLSCLSMYSVWGKEETITQREPIQARLHLYCGTGCTFLYLRLDGPVGIHKLNSSLSKKNGWLPPKFPLGMVLGPHKMRVWESISCA